MPRAPGADNLLSLCLRFQSWLTMGRAHFELNKTVTLTGKLTRIDLINPHSWLYFDVTEPDGRVTHHRCEMRSVHVLRRSGWTKEQFPVGARIVIEASPDRADPTSCYLQTITFADGTHMDRYGQHTKASQGGLQEVRGPVVVPKSKRELRRPDRRAEHHRRLGGRAARDGQSEGNWRRLGAARPARTIQTGRAVSQCGRGRASRCGCRNRATALWRHRTDARREQAAAAFKREDNPRFRLRDNQHHFLTGRSTVP